MQLKFLEQIEVKELKRTLQCQYEKVAVVLQIVIAVKNLIYQKIILIFP
jgi:hypothetical protein